MSAKVALETPLLSFEVDILELCQVLRDFVGVSLDADARKALKEMIVEVDKNFQLVVEVLTPLYAINTAADFRERWPELFRKFKTQYLSKWHSLSTRCGIVSQHLQRIQSAHDWKRRLPVLRNAVKRLDDIGDRWMANDAKLYEAMNGFMQSTNNALMSVNGHRSTPAKALKEIQAVLRGTEKTLLQIKAYSNELELISARLTP